MALAGLFKLEKLTIRAYAKQKRTGRPLESIQVMFNPTSFSMQHENVFQDQQGGTRSSQSHYSHGKSQTLSLRLIIDGTGVADFGVSTLLGLGQNSVARQVEQFLDACVRKNSDTHESNFLKIQWGKGPLQRGFDCRLQSVNINYTSFDRDGSPLRAELDTRFIEDIDALKLANLERTNSPDLSHSRTVKRGDTLPGLCLALYGSSEHYIRVAQFNQLDDFRNLTPGDTLIFPPLETDP